MPIAAAFILLAIGKKNPKIRDIFFVSTTGLTFGLVLYMYSLFIGKGANFGLQYSLSKALGLGLNFGADSLSILVAIITSFAWFIVSIYALGYMDHDPKPNRFYFFLLLVLGSNLGVLLTTDLFSLFLFFEGLGILSYPLIIHEETPEAFRAGTKYMLLTITGGLMLLGGIFLLYIYGGSFALTNSLSKVAGLNTIKTIIAFCLLFGFGVKAGIVPVHVWLPDAHPVAPSPASALLSGIMLKAGGYGIIRTLYVLYGINLSRYLGIQQVLITLAVITMILGSLVALRQTEIKRLLAYSSVAQMGYVLLGAALMTQNSVTGAMLHIFNHALMKATLFLSAGAIIHHTGLRKLDDLVLLGRKMPAVMVAFTIAAASMIGIPPTAGFVSKWYLATGITQAIKMNFISYNWGLFLIGALLVSSILNLLYYGSIILKGWIGVPMPQIAGASGTGEHVGNLSWKMLAPIMIFASAIIIFGLFPQFPVGIAQNAAKLLTTVIK
jgi:multicomponent Na+:H+ antiporter subunit D